MLLVERCAPATLLAPVKGKRCAADAAPLTGASRGGGREGVGTRGVLSLFDYGSAGSNAGQRPMTFGTASSASHSDNPDRRQMERTKC